MSITYTIREVKPDHLVVDYSDGSWAEVPIDVSMTESDIEQQIRAFGNPPATPFSSVKAVPVKAGDTGSIDPPPPAKEPEATDPNMTGSQVRAALYPKYNEFLEALQAKESGDSTAYDQIMTDVEGLQQAFTDEMAIKQSDLNKILEGQSA